MFSRTCPMKLRRVHSVGLAVLGSALVLFSSSVGATSSESVGSCIPDLVADGNCDSSQNNEVCGYDGGDCCECTCISTDDSQCGKYSGFACIDPGASCGEDGDVTASLEYASITDEEMTTTSQCLTGFISDGDCDPSNNNEACDYDGGDCCECTCVSTDRFTCGDEIQGGFACVDPSAACVDDDDDITLLASGTAFVTADAWCWLEYLSDGDCDPVNNKSGCDYDGGDCCECTCVSTTEYACGDEKHGGFVCVDPSASCVDDDDVTTFYTDEYSNDIYTSSTYGCMNGHLSDGNCDLINNREECDYDGGDCCECTCVSTADYTCGDNKHGGFTCLDPQCVDDNDNTTTESDDFSDPGDTSLPESDDDDDVYYTYTSMSDCWLKYISDGDCDWDNNIEACGYDGGDCCECTCASTENYTCGEGGLFNCIDPDASCVDDDDFTERPEWPSRSTTSSALCATSYLSDGVCDTSNNNEECGYDGGDCCECTCVSTVFITCGKEYHGGYDCLDPQCLDDNDDTISPESDDHSETDDDDIIFLESDEPSDIGDTTDTCFGNGVSDGACDHENNNEQCGYDGGDCCECTCVSTTDFTCGDNGYDCFDPSSSCEEEYVEAGTKTTITASANAYDTRAGDYSGGVGCGENGCAPALTRDGITDTDAESRWSCARKLVSDGASCAIEFVFEDPQDINEVQVAFYKGDERSRTVEASINGGVVGEFDSDTRSSYSIFDVQSVGVATMTFTAVGLAENDWISFTEVRFMVEA